MTVEWPEPKKHRAGVKPVPKAKPAPDEEGLPVVIQGKRVDSKEEARAYIGTVSNGHTVIFHYSLFGGSHFRLGLVIDLVVMTAKPKPRPVFVQSTYWHGGAKRLQDAFNIARVKQRMGHVWGDPVEVWDTKLRSIAQAKATMAQAVGEA